MKIMYTVATTSNGHNAIYIIKRIFYNLKTGIEAVIIAYLTIMHNPTLFQVDFTFEKKNPSKYVSRCMYTSESNGSNTKRRIG